MQKLLELLKSLKFLEAASYVITALVVIFFPDVKLEAGVLLLSVVAVLKLFGIQPELRLKALLKEAELKAKVVKKAKK
jgi:hypothetical protein